MNRDQIILAVRERIVAFAASRYRREFAEDVAQEVLEVLVEKYPHVTSITELVPLSLKIARFKMQSSVRTSVRRGEFTAVPVDEAPLPDPQPDPEQQAGSRERVEQLQAALRGLGERCRQLLRLKLQGKKFAEIQAEMGAASINTIYTWDLRCRKQLLDAMGGDWEEGRGK